MAKAMSVEFFVVGRGYEIINNPAMQTSKLKMQN
jgi:hypothetical protein